MFMEKKDEFNIYHNQRKTDHGLRYILRETSDACRIVLPGNLLTIPCEEFSIITASDIVYDAQHFLHRKLHCEEFTRWNISLEWP